MADGAIRIGIDGLNLAMPRGTGVATYGRTLARAVRGMGGEVDLLFGLDVPRDATPTLRETLFFEALAQDEPDTAIRPRLSLKARWHRAMVSPLPRRAVPVAVAGRVFGQDFTEQLPEFDRLYSFGGLWSVAARYFKRYGRFLPLEVARPPDVMHWTYPVPITLRGAANVYTIHDLVPLRLPHTSLENKRYHERLLRACVARADRICTVSEVSRRDLIDLLDADPARTINCYQALDPVGPIAPEAVETQLRRLFDLAHGSYFLFFGAIEPKKNLGRLIEAYLSADIAAPLVIVGGRSWKAERELTLLGGAHGARLPGADRIRMLDYLPRRLLDVLIRGARAVVFPSLYEGFGLPPLEALARGVPTIVSTGGALPEIAGSAALLVDPYDVGAIARALREVDGDAALRATLAAAGPARAERFSLDRFQDRLAGLYAPLLPSGARLATVPTLALDLTP